MLLLLASLMAGPSSAIRRKYGFEIATASADDVRRIRGWAKDEGWNPANTDWVAFHAIDPGAFLIGRLDGEPVVSISVTRYGAGFGFLGCYIARPVVRGKGYGLQIWNAGMKRLEGRNVGLDGVPAQQANYKKSGYRLAWNNVRYEGGVGDGTGAGRRQLGRCAQLAVRQARGLRPPLLPGNARELPGAVDHRARGRALVALKDGEIAGFGVIRGAGAGSSRIGPLYAATPAIAAALVSALGPGIAGRGGGDEKLPERNKAAVGAGRGV